MIDLIKEDIQGIIFDCDGTLVDTMAVHYAAWDVIFKKYDIKRPLSYLDHFSSSPSWVLAEHLVATDNLDIDASSMANEKEDWYFENLHEAKVHENVLEYVKLYHKKLPMVVLSGGLGKGVRKSLDLNDLSKYFDRVIGADDGFPPKTEPQSFIEVANAFCIPAGSWLVFEDGDIGLKNAKLAGMKTVDVRISPLTIS